MKSANLRVENVQRCYMLLLFSCYYHVVCTACDPVSGFSSYALVFQAVLMVDFEFVIWLPCTTSMGVQTVHLKCRRSAIWNRNLQTKQL